MIKLFSNHIIIKDPDGRQQPFDLDALRDDLNVCFEARGIQEKWIAESIVEVVYEHLCFSEQGGVGQCGGRLDRPQIDRLVGTILVNAGYDEVATDYSRLHIEAGTDTGLEAADWDRERIGRLLKQNFPLLVASGRRGQIVEQVAEKLRVLGFERVDDNLIVSLVGLAGQQMPEQPVAVVEEPASKQTSSDMIFSSSRILAVADSTIRDLLDRQIITVASVSRLVPVLRLSLHLDRLAELAGPGPLMELSFFPLLCNPLSSIRSFIVALHGMMCEQNPHASLHPVRLCLSGMDKMLSDSFVPMGQGARRCLNQEIRSVVQAELCENLEFSLLVTD